MYLSFLEIQLKAIWTTSFLITILGGGVSLIFASFRHEQELKERQSEIQREIRDRRREIQRSLRSDLLEAFNEVKKIRRLLRAEAIIGNPRKNNELLIGDEYKKQINALIDAQLSIEFAYRVMKQEPSLFQDRTLVIKLKVANKYLRDIIDEYEKMYRNFSEEFTSISLYEFSRLYDFIRPSAEAEEIKEDFWQPLRDSLDIIGKVLQE